MEIRLDEAKSMTSTDNYRCLYKGESADRLTNVAPYLFVSQPLQFVDWLFSEGWGKSWGIYVLTDALPTIVYTHFRKFLIVKNISNKSLYFRFYDPRVLRAFLPTCTDNELVDFFGPVRYFLMEDADPAYGISFWLTDGQLKSARHSKQEAQQNYIAYLQARRAGT